MDILSLTGVCWELEQHNATRPQGNEAQAESERIGWGAGAEHGAGAAAHHGSGWLGHRELLWVHLFRPVTQTSRLLDYDCNTEDKIQLVTTCQCSWNKWERGYVGLMVWLKNLSRHESFISVDIDSYWMSYFVLNDWNTGKLMVLHQTEFMGSWQVFGVQCLKKLEWVTTTFNFPPSLIKHIFNWIRLNWTDVTQCHEICLRQTFRPAIYQH